MQDTKLSSLSGLEEIAHPLDLNVFGNDELVDVSAVRSIAGTVALENNASLTTADLGIVGALRIDDEIDSNFPEHHLEDLSLISGNLFQGQAAATDVSINHSSESGSSLRTIAVGCADDCLPLSLRVRAPHGLNVELSLAGVEYEALIVQSDNVTLANLQALLVPTQSVYVDIIPRALAEAYLAWLVDEGFVGEFEACVFDGEGPPACDDRILFP